MLPSSCSAGTNAGDEGGAGVFVLRQSVNPKHALGGLRRRLLCTYRHPRLSRYHMRPASFPDSPPQPRGQARRTLSEEHQLSAGRLWHRRQLGVCSRSRGSRPHKQHEGWENKHENNRHLSGPEHLQSPQRDLVIGKAIGGFPPAAHLPERRGEASRPTRFLGSPQQGSGAGGSALAR